MARTPKGAMILEADTMMAWLAETIQEKVGKENAGLMEITTMKSHSTYASGENTHRRVPPVITLKPAAGNTHGFRITIEVDA